MESLSKYCQGLLPWLEELPYFHKTFFHAAVTMTAYTPGLTATNFTCAAPPKEGDHAVKIN